MTANDSTSKRPQSRYRLLHMLNHRVMATDFIKDFNHADLAYATPH